MFLCKPNLTKPISCAGSVAATLGDNSACTTDAGNGRHGEIFSGRSVAEVRDGHLLIRWDGPAGYCWKLLLRYLNLVPSEHATYGFSLVRPGGKSPLVTVIVSISIYCILYYNISQFMFFMLTRRHLSNLIPTLLSDQWRRTSINN